MPGLLRLVWHPWDICKAGSGDGRQNWRKGCGSCTKRWAGIKEGWRETSQRNEQLSGCCQSKQPTCSTCSLAANLQLHWRVCTLATGACADLSCVCLFSYRQGIIWPSLLISLKDFQLSLADQGARGRWEQLMHFGLTVPTFGLCYCQDPHRAGRRLLSAKLWLEGDLQARLCWCDAFMTTAFHLWRAGLESPVLSSTLCPWLPCRQHTTSRSQPGKSAEQSC